jgi:hypothetical protein
LGGKEFVKHPVHPVKCSFIPAILGVGEKRFSGLGYIADTGRKIFDFQDAFAIIQSAR